MKIKTEKEFRAYQAEMESIITKGTSLGDMELLSEEDKTKYIAPLSSHQRMGGCLSSTTRKSFNFDY